MCPDPDDDDHDWRDTRVLDALEVFSGICVTLALLHFSSLWCFKKKAISDAPKIQMRIATLVGDNYRTETSTLQATDNIKKIVKKAFPNYNAKQDSLSLSETTTIEHAPQGGGLWPCINKCSTVSNPLYNFTPQDQALIVVLWGGTNSNGSITIEDPLNQEGSLNDDNDQAPLLEQGEEQPAYGTLAHPLSDVCVTTHSHSLRPIHRST
jgi:hypothetical protein